MISAACLAALAARLARHGRQSLTSAPQVPMAAPCDPHDEQCAGCLGVRGFQPILGFSPRDDCEINNPGLPGLKNFMCVESCPLSFVLRSPVEVTPVCSYNGG